MAEEGAPPDREACEYISCGVCREALRFPHTFAECDHGACAVCVFKIMQSSDAPTCHMCRGPVGTRPPLRTRVMGWHCDPSPEEAFAIEALPSLHPRGERVTHVSQSAPAEQERERDTPARDEDTLEDTLEDMREEPPLTEMRELYASLLLGFSSLMRRIYHSLAQLRTTPHPSTPVNARTIHCATIVITARMNEVITAPHPHDTFMQGRH